MQIVAQGLGLVLRGRTCTYYAKQLTQHAVMELTEFPILANEIDVCCMACSATGGHEGRLCQS